MILKDILAISGQPGLYKFLAQGKNAMIVEHLETGKRSSAFSSSKVSSLDDITVFAEGEDLRLGEIFDRIFEKEAGKTAVDSRADASALKVYFEEIVPEYSREKVYISDIRKIIQWYNILQRNDLLVQEETEAQAEPEGPGPETGKKKVPEMKSRRKDPGSKDKQ